MEGSEHVWPIPIWPERTFLVLLRQKGRDVEPRISIPVYLGFCKSCFNRKISRLVEPIDTEFRGDLFRSRTEARWAVFFSEVEEEYKYEPQGFNLNGTSYLPDFWLPDLEIWVEVKSDRDYSTKELRKAQLLSEKSRNIVAIVCGRPNVEVEEAGLTLREKGISKTFAEKYHIDLCIGPIWDRITHNRIPTPFEEDHWKWMAEKMRRTFQRPDIRFDGTKESVAKIREMFPHLLEQMGEDQSKWKKKWRQKKMAKGGYVWFVDEEGLNLIHRGSLGRRVGIPGQRPVNDRMRPLLNALRAAQQARFEHGESGKPSDFEPI